MVRKSDAGGVLGRFGRWIGRLGVMGLEDVVKLRDWVATFYTDGHATEATPFSSSW